MPGYKPPTAAAGEAGPPIEAEPTNVREPVLPHFQGTEQFDMITKDANDVMR
jgi:hypothetical protein